MRNPWTSVAAIAVALGGLVTVLGRGFADGEWDATTMGAAIMAVAAAFGLGSAKDAPPTIPTTHD
jgi:drug/metabolite transporter (DMT)-like permease